jgi:nucleoside-diphosphate-sugar epimerase
MSVMITGAGLVGSQIARLEQDAGRVPVLFDFAPSPAALADFVDLDKCVVVRGDVTNPLDLVAAVEQHDVRRICHTAAYGNLTLGSNVAPLTSTLVNTMGTAYVLEIARIFGLERVVLSSSSTLYASLVGGEDDGELGFEEAYPRPNNVYAANKLAAEDLGRAYRATFGLDVVAVRYAGVFGPWGPGGGGMLTTRFEDWLRGAMAGESVEVDLGGGDLIYSKDAAKGTYLACWADGLVDTLFNLSMGRVVTKQDIADAINAVVPGARATASDTPAPSALPPSPGTARMRTGIMRIERAHTQLGYEPDFHTEAAIRDYSEWIATHPK